MNARREKYGQEWIFLNQQQGNASMSTFDNLKTICAISSICVLAACGSGKPQATHFTSGNCPGPSVATLHFFAEPRAHLFPGAVRLEECPNGKYYMQQGDLPWVEITKTKADNITNALRAASRRVVRVVD
jgi:hypothetical protein